MTLPPSPTSPGIAGNETALVQEMRRRAWSSQSLVGKRFFEKAADALEAAIEVRDLWKQQHTEATKTKEMWHDSYLREKARALRAERERDEAMAALRCVRQQCETAIYNIGQREHDEAVLRSFQSIADFCARSVISSVHPVSASREQRGNEEGSDA